MLTELLPLKLSFRALSDEPQDDDVAIDSPDVSDDDDEFNEEEGNVAGGVSDGDDAEAPEQ